MLASRERDSHVVFTHPLGSPSFKSSVNQRKSIYEKKKKDHAPLLSPPKLLPLLTFRCATLQNLWKARKGYAGMPSYPPLTPHALTAACTTSRTRARRRDFFTVGRSRTTGPLRSGSQGSFPGIVARNRRPGCLKGPSCLRQTGLPHPVREPRTFLAPELRPLELTRFTVAVNRTAFNSGERPTRCDDFRGG